MPRPKWDVFISYSSKNRAQCLKIRRDLERAGLRCWQDASIIRGGMRVREEIESGIRRSACIVILLSKHSLKSRWVLNELDAAMLREIRQRRTLVIPVLLGGVKETQIPTDLQGKYYIDLRSNFARQYRRNRELLLRSIDLVSHRSPPGHRITRLGRDAMSYLFSRRYDGRPVSRLSEKNWEALVRTLVDPKLWKDKLRSGALRLFRARYGDEGARRLLMFVFETKRLNVLDWFTEAQFDDAMLEAEWFIIMMAVHERALKQGDQGIEMKVGRDLKFRYRSITRAA